MKGQDKKNNRKLPVLLGAVVLCLLAGSIIWKISAGSGEVQTKDTESQTVAQVKDDEAQSTAQTEEDKTQSAAQTEADKTQNAAQTEEETQTETGSTGEDVKIPLSEISTTASFYDADIDGTTMEIVAVKGSDGAVHLAFNTCQVCFGSGKGYYVQDGDELVCQNCGNRFPIDEVGEARNGCNPVPITEEDAVTDGDSITISNAFLTEYEAIFENWKVQ